MDKLLAASKILPPKELLSMYKNQAARLLPEPEYTKVIPVEEQLTELQHLRETIHYERFFFVVNLHKMEIEHVNWIKRLLLKFICLKILII
jgi:hypothetical protein